jgi:hypothetical protein
MKSGCPDRPRKFLFYGFFLPHEWVIYRVFKFIAHTGEGYIVEYRCPHCKAIKERHFVDSGELRMLGFSQHDLNKFSGQESWDAPPITSLPKPKA